MIVHSTLISIAGALHVVSGLAHSPIKVHLYALSIIRNGVLASFQMPRLNDFEQVTDLLIFQECVDGLQHGEQGRPSGYARSGDD